MVINAIICPLKGGKHSACQIAIHSLPKNEIQTFIFLSELIPKGYKLLSYKLPKEENKRTCLKCSRMFASSGPANRICAECRKNTNYSLLPLKPKVLRTVQLDEDEFA